jgi:transposase
MLRISSLPLEERITLEEAHKNSLKKHFRDRCQCILLSSEGFTVKNLASVYKTRTRTIYTWIHRYNEMGFLGLKIQPGRGLKSTMNSLTTEQIELIKAEIVLNPQSLRNVSTLLSEKFGFTISKPMLKKYLKKS